MKLRDLVFLCWWLTVGLTHTMAWSGEQGGRSWVVPKGVKFGDLQNLALQPDTQLPAEEDIEDHQDLVQVATKAIGLNFADVFAILGFYKAANQVRSAGGGGNAAFCPGLEFSGVVVNSNSSQFKSGDRVYGFRRFGCYRDVVTTKAEFLQKLPEPWTFEHGASFLVNALTAWHGLVTVGGMPKAMVKKSSETTTGRDVVVLIHSAAGGVGLWASEIAARRGGKVVGVVGGTEKVATFLERIQPLCPSVQCVVRNPNARKFEQDLCRAVLAARGVDSNEPEDSSAAALIANNLGVDFVMESYGGIYFRPSLNLVNPGGSLVTYGSTTYNGDAQTTRIAFLPLLWKYLRRPQVDPGELTTRNIRVGGFNLIFLTERIQLLQQALADFTVCLVGDKKEITPPVVGATFDFESETVEALSALRSGTTVGKVVLVNRNNPCLGES